MENIFNAKRFLMLLKKEAYELRSQYVRLILIAASVIFVAFFMYSLSKSTSYIEYRRIFYSLGALIVFVTIVRTPFSLYENFNNKINGVNYYMLPASQAEKWLSMFSHCVIITPIVLFSIITLIDLCLYPFYPWADKSLWFTFSSHTNLTANKILSALITVFAFQSLSLLGTIWFKDSKSQKTIGSMIILLVVYIIFLLILASVSGLINIARTFPAVVNISFGDMSYVPQTWKIVSKTITFLIAPIGLWIVSFMKMKEQQI